MATVLLTGGTGMIGKAITRSLLEKGYEVIILTRQIKPGQPTTGTCRYALWSIDDQTIDTAALAAADAIIHLAGEGIADKRLTYKRKQAIINSRVESGRFLVKCLHEKNNKVKVVVSASAIGWYGEDKLKSGDGKPVPFMETDPAADNFLGQTCLKWEESVAPVVGLGKRLVKLRIGIVLSEKGGALPEFERPLKFGFAAILGNGKQVISWIHIQDLVNLFVTAIENDQYAGAYNAVAPFPVTNKELTLQLARIKTPRFFIRVHVPAFVLKIALGELSTEVLKSATVSDKKLIATGFVFSFLQIRDALTNLVTDK
jgi:uncharacterized protein (TIGR01777 family)